MNGKMNGKRDGIQKASLAGLLAAMCLLSATAATKAEVSFTPGAWSTNDWIFVKSPRFNYMHGFVQREDGIENECPPVSGEEIFKKHCREVYSAMVLRERPRSGRPCRPR